MSNSKRSRKSNHPKHSSTHDAPNKSDNPRSRKRKAPQTRCGVHVLSSSQLSKQVRATINEVFNGENDLDKDVIEEPAVRLLEEVTEDEAIHAIQEFAERYKVAKHKILRSKAGYFRGVCQKYWKQNREHKKLQLLRKAAINPSPNGKYTRQLSALVSETIESLFTPASGLAVSIIDDSVQRRLTSLTDEQAIEALHEFCSAVMYRQDRIRNMNAYLMNIIKRRTTRSQSSTTKGNSTQDRTKSQTPSSSNGNSTRKDSADVPSLGRTPPRISSVPNKRTRSRSPLSTSSEDELTMKRIRSAGDAALMRAKPPMSGSDDPRLSLQLKSNPVITSSFDVREKSPDTPPPQWSLTQSAPSAPFHPQPRRRGGRLSPPIQRVMSDGYRYGKSPSSSSSRHRSPPRTSTQGMEFLRYNSDDDDVDDDEMQSSMVFVNDYDDEEDDIHSMTEGSFEDIPPSPPHLPSLNNKQRPSNGPPPKNLHAPRPDIMARNSKPVPTNASEEEYKQEIQDLKEENRKLRYQMEQMQIHMQAQIDALSLRQKHELSGYGHESPHIHPTPYYPAPQMYGGYNTPPTSGSNASTSARSGFYGDGGPFPPPGTYVPGPPFPPAGGFQPPFMPFLPPSGLSNPNAPMFNNLSAPNSMTNLPNLPNNFVPGYPPPHPHPHPAFAMQPM